MDTQYQANTQYSELLAVNQKIQRNLAKSVHDLENALQENIERRNVLSAMESTIFSNSQEIESFSRESHVPIRGSLFFVPYFKDRYGAIAPMNEETEKKLENGCLDMYTVKCRPWLNSERNILQQAVGEEYKEFIIKKWMLKKKITAKKLEKMDTDGETEEELIDNLDQCTSCIKFFEVVPLEKIEVPLDFNVDWSNISAQKFDGYRTADECHLQWVNNLHPSIEKNDWSEFEDITITKMVSESSGKPNWFEIAQKINTNRIPFQVMKRYVSYIAPLLKPAKWSKENDDILVNTINTVRVGKFIPWSQVSHYLLGFTSTQIQTRWRVLNPNHIQGNFTREDDFILIKGLYKFGLHWDAIINYLPGRQRFQVKNRVKRAILPGLTYRPWKALEDKKILEYCSSKSEHWRVITSMLPTKRYMCEVRLRYYILQFWQTLTGRTVMPPPLFPLSTSVIVPEINALKKKLNACNRRFTNIDISLMKDEDQEFYKSTIVEERSSDDIEDLSVGSVKSSQKTLVLPKRSCNIRAPSWPSRALVEFFLPSRHELGGAHNAINHKAAEVTAFLARMFQLKINRTITPVEASSLETLNFTKQDLSFANSLVYQSSAKDPCGDLISLIPPNSVTVGAFRSLLLHKHKLKEMSQKIFLFHRIPPSLFFKLGTKEKNLNTILANNQGDSDCDEDTVIAIHQEDPEKSKSSHKRAAASRATSVNAAIFNRPPSLAQVVANQNLYTGSMPQNLGRERMECELSKEDVIKKEDKLLFNRMLSTFFWPAMFTNEGVAECADIAVGNKISEMFGLCDIQQDDDNEKIFIDRKKPNEFGGKYGHLDIPEQEEMVKILDRKTVRNFVPISEEDKETEYFVVKGVDDCTGGRVRLYKKELLGLKRSLVTKRLWDERRKGIKPARKEKNSGKRKLTVEGSRQSQRLSKRRLVC